LLAFRRPTAAMNFDAVVARLTTSLQAPLPGAAAQGRLAPQPRREWPKGFNPDNVREAAVLVLIFPLAGRPHIVLTLRSGTLGRHSGQISLPGGVVEAGETFEQSALREAHEEVGLKVADAHVIGLLTPLDVPISGFRLHPVVAVTAARPALRPADGEVERILEIPLDTLCDRRCLVSNERKRDGRRVLIPAFQIGTHEIWGATAMVLAEFLVLLGWEPQLS
jgi:8-oxo-dGTP pyrophosphatase MutT (NUDIX family)